MYCTNECSGISKRGLRSEFNHEVFGFALLRSPGLSFDFVILFFNYTNVMTVIICLTFSDSQPKINVCYYVISLVDSNDRTRTTLRGTVIQN